MMSDLLVIVGLPGSGKSTLIRELKRKGFSLIVEDFMKDVDEDSPIRLPPRFTDSRHYSQLISALRAGKRCVIADIIFCDTLARLEAEAVLKADVPELTITWEFFENAPAKCLKNAEARGRECIERERRLIQVLSERYFIPVGVKPRKVFTQAKRASARGRKRK